MEALEEHNDRLGALIAELHIQRANQVSKLFLKTGRKKEIRQMQWERSPNQDFERPKLDTA